MTDKKDFKHYIHFHDEPVYENGKLTGYALVSECVTDESKLTPFDKIMQPVSKNKEES